MWNKTCHLAGVVLWALAALALVLAWVAVARRGLVFGLEPLAWYWNALVLGVLSMGTKACKENGCCTSSTSAM